MHGAFICGGSGLWLCKRTSVYHTIWGHTLNRLSTSHLADNGQMAQQKDFQPPELINCPVPEIPRNVTAFRFFIDRHKWCAVLTLKLSRLFQGSFITCVKTKHASSRIAWKFVLKLLQNILSYPDWRRQKVKALHFNRRCLNHERFLTSRKLADARRTVAHIWKPLWSVVVQNAWQASLVVTRACTIRQQKWFGRVNSLADIRNMKVTLTRDSNSFAATASTLDEVTSGVKSQHLHTQHNR